MTYWADDRALYREQKALDARQAEAKREIDAAGGACDLCHGSGKNTSHQLWPDYPPPCRACAGAGKAST